MAIPFLPGLASAAAKTSAGTTAAAGTAAAAKAAAAAAAAKTAAAAAPAVAGGLGSLATGIPGALGAVGKGAAGAAAAKTAAAGLPGALGAVGKGAAPTFLAAINKAAPAAAAAPSAVPPLAGAIPGVPLSATPGAFAPPPITKGPITQGLGNLVQAPAGANLAGNIAATDSMVKAGAQGAMKAGANPSQAAQMGQRLKDLGKALSGSGQGGAEPAEFANHEVSYGKRQPQAGGPMTTLPQQGVEESPGAKLFNNPMTPMGGGMMPMTPMGGGMMPMKPMPMSPMQPEMLSGEMYAKPMPMMRDGGYIRGPGTGRSDSIPARIYQDGRPVQEARLSDGEFVMTERAVRGAGNGDQAKGAARMYRLMREFEKGGRVYGRA